MPLGLSPQRPQGFYQRIIEQWSRVAASRGLTHSEAALCFAQAAGLAIINTPASSDQQEAMIEVCARAMSTAYMGGRAKREGWGHPVTEDPA